MKTKLLVTLVSMSALLVGLAGWLFADPTPEELTDLTDPAGVDAQDVQAMFRLITGENTPQPHDVLRGDVAPGTLLSDPGDPLPHRVQPNPVPSGEFDIGDAVLAARRAAGDIVFDGLNQSPTVSLQGDQTITNQAGYTLRGSVNDDQNLDGAHVDLWQNGEILAENLAVQADGSFSFSATLLEGENLFVALARDAFGREGEASEPITVTLDTEAPTLSVTEPTDGVFFHHTPLTVTGDAADNRGIAQVLVDGVSADLIEVSGSWLFGRDLPFSAQGPRTLEIVAQDLAGNDSEPVSLTVTFDTDAPTLTVDAMTSPTNQHQVTLTGTASDSFGVQEVRINGQTANLNPDSETFDLSVDLVEGDNVFEFIATDYAGNESLPQSVTLRGDYTPAMLELLSAEFVNSTPYTYLIGISEPITVQSINGVDDGTRHEGDSFQLADVDLNEGENTLTLVVRDDAGNESTAVFVVTLDTTGPDLEITSIHRDGYQFTFPNDPDPDEALTNAPTLIVEGTVSDASSGVAQVMVNGYAATVNGDTWRLGPLPIIPRDNVIAASATDGAGNASADSITVYQDVEGPEIELSFRRGAHVTNLADLTDPSTGYYDGTGEIEVTGQATDLYNAVTGLVARFGGVDLEVQTDNDYADFRFTLPAALFAQSDLYVLNLVATDSFGNDNENNQSALVGEFAHRGGESETVENGAGLGLAASALSLFSGMIEEQVESMDGAGMINESVEESGVTVNITGMAFCDPADVGRSRYSNPDVPPMDPPTSRYGCEQQVTVDMSINEDGHVAIVMSIPDLFIDMDIEPVIFVCWGGTEAYALASPATISLLADFTEGPDGPVLTAVPNSVQVDLANTSLGLQDCGVLDWILGFAEDTIIQSMEDEFSNQIQTILDSLGSALAASLMSQPNTGFELFIGGITNDVSGMKLWLDFFGNPCADPSDDTDKADPESPTGYKPCPSPTDDPLAQRIYDAPGYLITRNADDNRPTLDLLDSQGAARTLEAVINDDLVNYMVFAEWAQGTMNLLVDQELVGDTLSLDSSTFGIFLPELTDPNRTDVQEVVPSGTPMVIEVFPMLPPTINGINGGMEGLRLRAGDLVMRFLGDTNGDGSFETPLFDIAVTLFMDAELTFEAATGSLGADAVLIDLSDPQTHADLIWSAFVLNEASVRAMVPTVLDLALPVFTESLSRFELPGNGMRFSELHMVDPGAQFVQVIGDMQAQIFVLQPTDAQAGDVTLSGYASGLVAAGNALDTTFEVAVNGEAWEPDTLTLTPHAADGTLDFAVTINQTLLLDGENTVRLALEDGNNPMADGSARISYQTLVLEYDEATGETTVTSGISEGSDDLLGGLLDFGGCMGCSESGPHGATGLFSLVALLALVFWRRRAGLRHAVLWTLPLLIVLLVGCDSGSTSFLGVDELPDGDVSTDDDDDDDLTPVDGDVNPDDDDDDDSSDGDDEIDIEQPPNDFTGPDVDDDPVVVVNMVRLGDETEGFNLDENRSPQGDPDPDNGMAGLAGLANGPLDDAVNGGSVLLLLRFKRLNALPAAGESGTVDIEGYLGVDLDDDPTNNFDGNQTFGIDPMSFDEQGNRLIDFPLVQIWADEEGKVHLLGGPTVFTLSIPLDDEGNALSLTITETQLAAMLTPSTLRATGLDLNDGLLGGIIPCQVLAQPVDAIGGIAPLRLVNENVDIDLNEDGVLDTSTDDTNMDGVTAAIVLSGVPAYLDDGSANRAPTIALNELPASVTEPHLTVSGSITDPDGNCELATVSLKLNDTEPVAAVVTAATEGCEFTGDVTLALGENLLVATVTDERGAEASASGGVTLSDAVPPVVTITDPTGPQVTEATFTVSGTATDNVGVAGVQLVITDGPTYAVLGSELGENGEWSVEVTLPGLGSHTLTAQAKDQADLLSEEATLTLELVDVNAPLVEITEVSDGTTTVNPPDDLEVHKPDVTIKGSIHDDFGDENLTLGYTLNGSAAQSLSYDPLFGSFEFAATLTLGDNTLVFTAADANGNTGDTTVVIRYSDTTKPVIAVLSPDPLVHETEQTLVFTVTDDVSGVEEMTPRVQLNGGIEQSPGFNEDTQQFSLPLSLSLGDNEILIRVSDTSNNEAELTGTVILEDINAPVLLLDSPEHRLDTLEDSVLVSGTVSDDIGLATPPLVLVCGETSLTPDLEDDGTFSVNFPLALGENLLRITATDLGGLVTEKERLITRHDPDAPASVSLTIEPNILLLGTGHAVLSISALRYAGGPVPAGTEISLTMNPEGYGTLADSVLLTQGDDGIVQTTFVPGMFPQSVEITATAGEVFDAATVTISEPNLAVVDICREDDAQSFAGADFMLSYQGQATTLAPASGSAETLALSSGFHITNTNEDSPRVLLAGTSLLTTEGAVARLGWPLDGGVPTMNEFSVGSITYADLLGNLLDGEGLAVCALDNQLGDLPPQVQIAPLPSSVTDAELTVLATASDENLDTCTARWILNGTEQEAQLHEGSAEAVFTLMPGANEIILEVTDENGNVGQDRVEIWYAAPNDPPVVTITEPGSATSLEAVTVEGTLSDDGPLSALTVQARVGSGEWVLCTVNEAEGRFASNEPLPLAMGWNTLRVQAVDALAASTTASLNVQRLAPVTPPVISLDSPSEGEDFQSNPITVSGSVAEGGNAAQITVTLTLNGVAESISFSPFTRRFDAQLNLVDGDNEVVVRAEDITGQSDDVTRHVTFTAPDAAPVLSISSPEDGASLAASEIQVQGSIADDRPLTSLAGFTVNGVEVTLNNPEGMSSTWQVMVPLSEGQNVLQASVEDARGNLATSSVTVNNVAPPVIVLNMVRIGNSSEGFNVDQIGDLGDLGPDNALSGLGNLANPMLEDQLTDAEDPLLLILEITGLAGLPQPGDAPVMVTINGYIGQDTDGNSADNFSGTENFTIDEEASYDPVTGLPLIRFENVEVFNDFGVVRINTYPDNPATFNLEVASGETPLEINVTPAFMDAVLMDTPNGIGLGTDGQGTTEPALLGGVVPAGNLAVTLELEGQEIVPLELLLRNDPTNPIPDVDLNEDGSLDTTTATADNPDGVSVGIMVTGVPCQLQR